MEIRQLMYFIQIVKSGTYSAAAKQLYLCLLYTSLLAESCPFRSSSGDPSLRVRRDG